MEGRIMAKIYKNAVPTTKASKVVTPQNQAIPGREADMVKNSAGGVTFAVDMFTQLDRFLILGSEGGSYYASERKLTEQNAKNVIAAIQADGVRVVNRIVEISTAGRAPKNDPALYALALAMTYGNDATKAAAYRAIPQVARIGTHILHLADYVNTLRGWGRGLRTGFARWYNEKSPLDLAHQLVKYANRDGWTHKDILRLAHVKPVTPTHDALFTDTVGKSKAVTIDTDVAEFMAAVNTLRTTTNAKAAAKLISDFKLPREVVPTELLNEKEVWAALLPHMGAEALVRNLATLTRNGLVAPLSESKRLILDKMGNEEWIKRSKIHPIKVLAALMTYNAGRGVRGSNVWTPDKQIVDALDAMFYATFQNIIPTGKNWLLGIDVSGSMTMGTLAGVPGLSPNVASAALAMITARTETNYEIMGFTNKFISLGITANTTLERAIRLTQNASFGSTDCAEPMEWARKNKIPVDVFAVYTDSETWAGFKQPVQALRDYRREMGRDAKSIVVGMVANNFTIADPTDAGMLDVVGFDTATPTLMADFARGAF